MGQRFSYLFLFLALAIQPTNSFAQNNLWHGTERKIHYKPDGEDFLLVNGSKRFNRALYGGNTAFRVEAGDLRNLLCISPAWAEI